MRAFAIALCSLLLSACAPDAQENSATKDPSTSAANHHRQVKSTAKLIIDRIDASAITRGLQLSHEERGTSDNGRVRVRWTIKDLNRLEIIGNDQADADLVGWSCSTYDGSGNYISPVPIDSPCGKFFESLLANVVSSPNDLAQKLLNRTHKTSGDAIWVSGDFSIETNGQFFFVRRTSRQ